MTNFYKGHKRERTAQLHKAYDTMERKAALKYAMKELNYTDSGALSWFSDWSKEDVKQKAIQAKTDAKKAASEKAAPKAKKAPTPKTKKAPAPKAKKAPAKTKKAKLPETAAA
jgi:hypothetical protein